MTASKQSGAVDPLSLRHNVHYGSIQLFSMKSKEGVFEAGTGISKTSESWETDPDR